MVTQREAEAQVRREKARAPAGSGKAALSEEGIRRVARARVRESESSKKRKFVGTPIGTRRVDPGVPTSPEKAKRIRELERQNIQRSFSRARLRGDIVKTKLGVLVPKNKSGLRILRQAIAVDKRVQKGVMNVANNRVKDLERLIKGRVLTDKGKKIAEEELRRLKLSLLSKKALRTQDLLLGKTISDVLKRPKKFVGVLRADVKLKGLPGLTEKVLRAREKQLTKLERGRGGITERVFTGVVILGLLGAARGSLGVVQAFTKPVKFVKSQIQAIRHPLQTIKTIGQDFVVDPVGTVVEFVIFAKALRLVGRTAKVSPVGRFVAEEMFIRSQPFQIQKAVRKIIKSAKIQEKINPSRIKDLKRVDFFEVKSLTRTEVKVLTKTIKQTDSVIFGSLAARTISGKRTPIPKDVDLATRDVSVFNRAFINNLPRNIRKNYVVKKQKIFRDGVKLFDVKSLNRLIPRRNLLTKKGFLPVSGFVTKIKKVKGSVLPRLVKRPGLVALEVPTQKLVKIGDIKIVGFGEQTTRKALGTLQVLIEKNSRRAKDPQAFIISLKIQRDFLRQQKPKTRLKKSLLNSKINKLSDAIKLLESKGFIRLLESKVKGLTNRFPLVAKISPIRLRKLNKRIISKRFKVELKSLKKTGKAKSQVVNSFLPKSVKRSSLLPKRKPSKIPVSKVPKKRPSKLPSKLKRKVPSRFPKKRPSQIPSKLKRKAPSRLKGKKPSKLPGKLKRRVSKLPVRKAKALTTKQLKLRLERRKQELKRKVFVVIKKQKFIFIPDLFSEIFGIRASPREAKALLKPNRVFTGAELRKLVRR